MYTPETITATTLQELVDKTNIELQKIAREWNSPREALYLKTLYASPRRILADADTSMIVKADGTSFNPGAGAGFYGRTGSAWVKF